MMIYRWAPTPSSWRQRYAPWPRTHEERGWRKNQLWKIRGDVTFLQCHYLPYELKCCYIYVLRRNVLSIILPETGKCFPLHCDHGDWKNDFALSQSFYLLLVTLPAKLWFIHIWLWERENGTVRRRPNSLRARSGWHRHCSLYHTALALSS